MTFDPLPQAWPVASSPRPIVFIGAGGIVRTSHLPAYRRMGYPVAGLFDVSADAARQTAAQFEVPVVFRTLDEAAGRAAGRVRRRGARRSDPRNPRAAADRRRGADRRSRWDAISPKPADPRRAAAHGGSPPP